MVGLLSASLRRIHRDCAARHKFAARTRYLDAHALTELGFPPTQQKSRLCDWLSVKR